MNFRKFQMIFWQSIRFIHTDSEAIENLLPNNTVAMWSLKSS
ncbi:hypothetical protein T08_2444 [Trichinella sp. T8]|nr:hypothetical protein T08_2444 [Trichinella sp. T8]